jgi:hypothetical protein
MAVRYGAPGIDMSGSTMFDTYLIEIENRSVAILTRLGRTFSFHAVDPSLSDMNGVCFPDTVAAERAIRRRLRQRGHKSAA